MSKCVRKEKDGADSKYRLKIDSDQVIEAFGEVAGTEKDKLK